jgi:hypothetical protein
MVGQELDEQKEDLLVREDVHRAGTLDHEFLEPGLFQLFLAYSAIGGDCVGAEKRAVEGHSGKRSFRQERHPPSTPSGQARSGAHPTPRQISSDFAIPTRQLPLDIANLSLDRTRPNNNHPSNPFPCKHRKQQLRPPQQQQTVRFGAGLHG